MTRSLSAAAAAALCSVGLLCAQDPAPPPPAPDPSTPATAAAAGAAAARAAFTPPTADPQPYAKVITKDAKSKKGLFAVHQVKDKFYYEIPKSEFDKDYLFVAQIARTTAGVGYGGQALNNRVVRWERNGNRVLLREVTFDVVADSKLPIAQAVKAANNSTIVMSFPVAAFGPEDSTVIEVTRLFTTDVFEMSAKQRLNATMMDATRSFLDRLTPYPGNIEAEATHTYTRMPTPVGASAMPNPMTAGGMRPGSATVVIHYSMVKLPEKPMTPRLFDERVGYFSVHQTDYGVDEHRAPQRRYITRWRLEKKDPSAALSEPVKPIVYYIDAATPKKWVPYMIKGVESWQAAFEEAGFKHAIVAKVAPTPEQDPDFSPEDARYSVIRWLPSTIENAVGPHIHDPRTGEILDADIQFYHNVMNLQRDWYFLQAGAVDKRAQQLPLPDDLMGRLIEYVCAHEVGHTLGFQHNMKSSSTYPADKIRDREWVKKMGHTPSLMDYSRFNYVAQPEDNIDPADLVPGIGPYDKWATMWGYKPIENVKTAEDEKKTLDEWARAQDKTPWLRFSTPGSGGADPGELTEAVGDADAVKSTALGIKNLQRVSKFLLTASTVNQPGEPYEDLSELYGRMIGQWAMELNHVAAIVGGFDTRQKNIGQEGVLYTPISKTRQMEAVQFLNETAFMTPNWAIDRDILRRIEPIGALSRVNNAQRGILNNLLSSARFARLGEQEALDGSAAYTPVEFLGAVRRGIWRELEQPQVKVDPYRRNLQRTYLDIADSKINGASTTMPVGLPSGFPTAMFASSGDEKPLYRAELHTLNSSIAAALAKTQDRTTRAHLEAARDQIARILDPKFARTNTAASSAIRIMAEQNDIQEQVENCWPDYSIKP